MDPIASRDTNIVQFRVYTVYYCKITLFCRDTNIVQFRVDESIQRKRRCVNVAILI